MAAFHKVLSGIPAFDQAVDYIRMGDNVVWRVSDLEEFRRFADPFVEQAKRDGRNIVYFRFAGHPELVLNARRSGGSACPSPTGLRHSRWISTK